MSTTLTKQKFLNDSEVAHLFQLCNKHKGERDSIMIRFALFTGARSAEIVEVELSDLEQNTVTIYGKKNSNDRCVPLDADFYQELVQYCKENSITGKLFPITTRMFRKIWDKYRINHKKGLHACRHTAGITHYANCKDIKATQSLLGHKEIANTQVYVDFIESADKLRTTVVGMYDKKVV